MRCLATVGLLALLAACGKGPSNATPGGPVGGGEPDGPIASGRAAPGEASNAVGAGQLPPAGPQPRFIGKWAEDQKSCQSAAWQFTVSTLRSPGGESCSFDHVNPAAGGYDIQATCTAKGAPSADVLKVRFAESAKAMLISSKSLGDKGLVYCGQDV